MISLLKLKIFKFQIWVKILGGNPNSGQNPGGNPGQNPGGNPNPGQNPGGGNPGEWPDPWGGQWYSHRKKRLYGPDPLWGSTPGYDPALGLDLTLEINRPGFFEDANKNLVFKCGHGHKYEDCPCCGRKD